MFPPHQYPEIYVLRHGQTKWNKEGRHQGWLNSPLTDLGHQQARDQGEILVRAGVRSRNLPILCSPQGRAKSTADHIAQILETTHSLESRLKEFGLGPWQGLLGTDIESNWPEIWKTKQIDSIDWYFNTPLGESFDELCSRAQALLASLRSPTILVTHGITSHVLRGLWLGLDRKGLCALPGGQGCVYHLIDGQHKKLVI